MTTTGRMMLLTLENKELFGKLIKTVLTVSPVSLLQIMDLLQPRWFGERLLEKEKQEILK